jgi:hypothetical protein
MVIWKNQKLMEMTKVNDGRAMRGYWRLILRILSGVDQFQVKELDGGMVIK